MSEVFFIWNLYLRAARYSSAVSIFENSSLSYGKQKASCFKKVAGTLLPNMCVCVCVCKWVFVSVRGVWCVCCVCVFVAYLVQTPLRMEIFFRGVLGICFFKKTE